MILSVGLVLPAILAGCASPPTLPTGRLFIASERGTRQIWVEIAETPDARGTGLMGRESLGHSSGMVFLFDEPTNAGFWMKDTVIPLSLAFWGEDGRILTIMDMTPCRRDPCPTSPPDTRSMGAVEANRGLLDELGVAAGDSVHLRRDVP